LVPHLQAAADIVNQLAEQPDGTTIDQEELRTTIRNLEHVHTVAPENMRPLIAAQVDPLQKLAEIFRTGVNQELQFQEFRSAGLELATRCEDAF
jgi:hypothetical protein